MRVLVCSAFLVLAGCTSPVKRVATSQNSYDFLVARYNETCRVDLPPPNCSAWQKSLNAWETHLHESARALKLGGGLPRQLAAIKADEKATEKVTK